MEFRRTRLLSRHTIATEVVDYDLPADPISHLVLTMHGYNVTDEATLAELLGFLNKVTVSKLGVTILDQESEDLYGVHAYLLQRLPVVTGRLATDDYVRTLTLVIPFGRRLYDGRECLPAAKKGDRKLRLDTTVPATSWDNAHISVDVVELPGASPARYLKTYGVTLAAPAGTGHSDIRLACGNRLLCHQFRLTTVPTTTSITWGINTVALKLKNQEYRLTSADMMCLQGERGLRIGCPDATIAAQGLSPLNLIAWLDYDPNSDEDGGIDLSAETDAKLDADYGVAEAEVLTSLELVGTGGGV